MPLRKSAPLLFSNQHMRPCGGELTSCARQAVRDGWRRLGLGCATHLSAGAALHTSTHSCTCWCLCPPASRPAGSRGTGPGWSRASWQPGCGGTAWPAGGRSWVSSWVRGELDAWPSLDALAMPHASSQRPFVHCKPMNAPMHANLGGTWDEQHRQVGPGDRSRPATHC